MNQEIITPKQVKKILGINSDTTLRKYETAGLPVRFYPKSNRKYYFINEVMEFMKK